MPDEQVVPDWCGYFNPDDYDRFCAALEEACGCYGAEGRDFDEGLLTMYAGHPPEECFFSLSGLATRCRDSTPADWDSICFRQVAHWVEGQAHRDRLTRTPFAEVEPLLRVWLSERPEPTYQGGQPDGPDECFAVPIADGLYVSFLARVPELDDASEMTVLVPNSAVTAWQTSAEQLLESVRAGLRRLPPPIWETHTVRVEDETGCTPVEMYLTTAAPGTDIPASSWAVLLDEVAPAPLPRGAYVLVPEQNTLIVMPNDETPDAETSWDRWWALFHVANTHYDNADHASRVTRQSFGFNPFDWYRARPWPQRWVDEHQAGATGPTGHR
ncbi:MAG TPA: hypothetical protein VFC19_46420 [Candidatus Limnocylindrales bacterium]|nr:hypothetical protein [Candidatus Limnocylindrales bacterium]